MQRQENIKLVAKLLILLVVIGANITASTALFVILHKEQRTDLIILIVCMWFFDWLSRRL